MYIPGVVVRVASESWFDGDEVTSAPTPHRYVPRLCSVNPSHLRGPIVPIDTRNGAADDRSPMVRPIAAMRRLAYVTVVGLLVAAAGCGDDGVGEGSFIGRVNGTDALLALLAHGDQALGYLSDGEQLSVWLRSGEINGEDMTLEDREGVQQGTARIGDGQVTGQLELDDTSYAFTLEPAEDQAGLYRGFADFGDGGTVEALDCAG